MTKEEKAQFVQSLADQLRQQPNFYVVDMGGMTVAESNAFRGRLFEDKLEVHMAKNTLIIKALTQNGVDITPLEPVLKQSSSLILAGEVANHPAKVLKSFLVGKEKPVLKGAWIEQSAFVGPQSLDALVNLKSKNELLGEIIGLLQSPMKNLVGALQSNAGNKIHALLEAMAARQEPSA